MVKPEQQQLPVELERRPAERVVITAVAQLSCLGDTGETWQGILEGRSGTRRFDVQNWAVNVAGPIPDHIDLFEGIDPKRRRMLTPVTAMAIRLAGEAGRQAKLIDGETGRLHEDMNRVRVAMCLGSGVGPTSNFINIYRALYGDCRENDLKRSSRSNLDVFSGLQSFPEEMNGQTAMEYGISGEYVSSVSACATGTDNIVEGYRKIKEGYADAAFAGAMDSSLAMYPEVSIAIFARMTVLSTLNDPPERASRPLDKSRKGFVLSDGGAVVVLESLEHATARGAPILAEIVGVGKSIDGKDATSADVDRVAKTMLQACWDEKSGRMHEIDVYFGHFTATGGDANEVAALRKVFGAGAARLPITAIKGAIGHSGGGAGAQTLVNAVLALHQGVIPPIANLEDPDDEFGDLLLVRDKPLAGEFKTALVSALGFGGHNAMLAVRKYVG